MSVPAVSLCVINHNGAAHLRRALTALDGLGWSFGEVLVVDNASEDDSLDAVAACCPHARLVALPRNLGPGGARNAGFASARNDLVLFQDNDVALCPGAVKRLVDRMRENERVLAVAPRVLHASDPERVQFDSADCHFSGFMMTRNAEASVGSLTSRSPDHQATRTTSLVTACFLLDGSRWSGGPLFDDSLGFNLEDHDFGVRASVSGHELWVEPEATVLHGGGTPGLSLRDGQRPSEPRLFYLIRNRWIVIAKCFSVRTLVLLAPALALVECMLLGWLVIHGRGAIWTRAVRSFSGRRRTVWAQRRDVQRGRRRGDACILRDGPLPLTSHVRRGSLAARVLPIAERLLRGYWRLVRRWIW